MTRPTCRYYTFQFHMQELSEALLELLHALRAFTAKLPANAAALAAKEQTTAQQALLQHEQLRNDA